MNEFAMMNNEQRAAIAAEALLLVDESLVCDLLANLMHYCDAHGFRFEGELETARMHYEAERSEETNR